MFDQKSSFKYSIAFSLVLLMLLGCNERKLELVFNTQNSDAQQMVLRSQMKVITSEDSAQPSALNSRLEARVRSKLLLAYDDGSARFQIVPDSVSYTSDQKSVEECNHIERYLLQQDFQFKMNPAGEMKDIRLEDFAPELEHTDIDLRRLLVKIQPVLPAAPVYVGYTWERQHYFAEDDKKSFIYKWFEVNDIYERNQQTLVRLRMNVKYQVDDLGDGTTRLSSDDFILGSGEILFNATQGVVEKGTLDVSGIVKVNDPAVASASPVRVLQSISLWREP